MKTTTQTNGQSTKEIEALDERLDAIKDILIGDTFKRLEKQIKGLDNMMESGNTHLISLVDEISKEVVELKSDLNRYKAEEGRNRFEDDEEIRNAVQKLNSDFSKRVEEQNEKLNRIASVKARISDLEKEAEGILEKVTAHLDDKIAAIENRVERKLEDDLNQKKEHYKALDLENQRVHKKINDELHSLEATIEKRIAEQSAQLDQAGIKISAEQIDELKREVSEELGGMKTQFTASEQDLLKRLQKVEEQSKACESKMLARIEGYREQLEKKIAQGGNNEELINRQNRFEKAVGNLMENMATKVSAKLDAERTARGKMSDEMLRLKNAFKEGNRVVANEQEHIKQRLQKTEQNSKALRNYVSEGHQVIASEQDRINQRIDGVEEKSHALKDVFENDIFKYLESMKQERQGLDQRMKGLQDEFSRQMHEATLRMETRMETMMEMNQRYMQNMTQASPQKSKKDELKETLKKLTELLDD